MKRVMFLDTETIWNPEMDKYLIDVKKDEVEDVEVKKTTKKASKDPRDKFKFDPNYIKIACLVTQVVEYNDDWDEVNSDTRLFRLTDYPNFNEKPMLDKFWHYICDANLAGSPLMFVTFNGMEFDIPLLYRRSWWNRSVPCIFISQKKYTIDNHLDIRAVLNNWNNYAHGNQDFYTKAFLGMETDDDLGPMVQTHWDNKEYDKIYDHCITDVTVRLRSLFQSMIGYFPGLY